MEKEKGDDIICIDKIVVGESMSMSVQVCLVCGMCVKTGYFVIVHAVGVKVGVWIAKIELCVLYYNL